MMNDRMMRADEVSRVAANISRIEVMLGHPLDPTMIDIDTLSKRSLSSAEVSRIAANISRVEVMRGNSYNVEYEELNLIGKIIYNIRALCGLAILVYILYGIIFVF